MDERTLVCGNPVRNVRFDVFLFDISSLMILLMKFYNLHDVCSFLAIIFTPPSSLFLQDLL